MGGSPPRPRACPLLVCPLPLFQMCSCSCCPNSSAMLSLSPLTPSYTHTHTHTRSPKLIRFVFCLLVSCKSGGTGRVSGRITSVHNPLVVSDPTGPLAVESRGAVDSFRGWGGGKHAPGAGSPWFLRAWIRGEARKGKPFLLGPEFSPEKKFPLLGAREPLVTQ